MHTAVDVSPGATIFVDGSSLHKDPIQAVQLHGGEFRARRHNIVNDQLFKVLVLRALGESTQETADRLYVSHGSVKDYSNKLMRIFEVHSIAGVVQGAFDHNVLTVTKKIAPLAPLSDAEKIILQAVADDNRIHEIATEEQKSQATVKSQLANARIKLHGVSAPPAAVLMGHLTGDLEPPLVQEFEDTTRSGIHTFDPTFLSEVVEQVALRAKLNRQLT